LKITADYREEASGLIDLLRNEEIIVEVRKVLHGDYIINGFVTIERKTARDFLISIVDGRLFRQLSNLKNHCRNPLLIIEGNPYETALNFDPMAIKGALISTQAIWHIPVLLSRSKEDTRDTILMIGSQEEAHMDVVPLRGGYRPKRLKSRQLYVLQGFPGVGPILAKRLVDHFRSVLAVMNASIAELSQVEGIGDASAQKIREVLDWETERKCVCP
jgi:DNA excision repair protein ERCC-4